MSYLKLFNNRHAALGTKHKKEQVIAPLFLKELNVIVEVPKNLDTDNFGTFTKDIKRLSSQKETALLKAKAAMELLNLDIGIASEGSFGPHPAVPFAITNTEVVVFVDKKLKLEIYGGHIEVVSYAQNCTARKINEVLSFAKNIDFPNHGIVIKLNEDNYSNMTKGIDNMNDLVEISNSYLKKYKSIWLETDFRAHVNLSRMKSIELASKDLIENINRLCPKCQTPGFHKIGQKPGLPCESCGRPTNVPMYDTYKCSTCNHAVDIIFPSQKKSTNAGNCDYCNP